MNSFLKYNIASILWTILILVLCLMPGKDMPSVSIFEIDKIAHFGIYLILALLMYYGWKRQNSFIVLHHHTFIKILLLTSFYGFLVEIMQELFTADRHFELLDALTNSMGAAAGSLLGKSLKQKLSL